MTVTGLRQRQALALSALLLGVVGVALLVFSAGSSYTIDAHFLDASKLVPGGEVEIAGRQVGSVSSVGLTADGEANIKLSIDDPSVVPLHLGTRAYVRAVGQGGIKNNYVALTPGLASAAQIPDGGVLPATQTTSEVNYDAILDSFGPAQRANLDRLIANGARVFAGSGAHYFNATLAKLEPALAELTDFSGQLALDPGALSELVQSGSAAAGAIASQSTSLTSAVTHTARVLGAIAAHRAALSDALARMAPVLVQARGTLARTGTALTALRPTLHDLVPVAAPLRSFLTQFDAVLPMVAPVLSNLRQQLPALDSSLVGLPPLVSLATRALDTLGPAMKGLTPIFHGLRFYGSDLVLGAFAGLIGIALAEYNGDGHYAKANFVQSLQTLVAGPLSQELSAHPLVPGILATRTGLTRRCPGGNQPPAPDGSNPWNLGPKYCTASQDEPASVNVP